MNVRFFYKKFTWQKTTIFLIWQNPVKNIYLFDCIFVLLLIT